MSKYFDRMDVIERLRLYDVNRNWKYSFSVDNFTSGYTVGFPTLGADEVFTFANHTQTITNKTITDSSNLVRATRLATSGADVTLVGNTGAPGSALVTTSTTAAAWSGGFSYIGNAQVLSEQSVSGNGSATELTYTTPNLPLGDYRIGWCYEHKMTAGLLLSSHRVWTYIDNTSNDIGETIVQSTISSDLYSISSGKYLWENVSGVHTIGVRQTISSLLGSADMRNIRVELFQV